MKYFNCHTHTKYSNIRLLDAIGNPKDIIEKAYELGLSGIAITDHECLSAAVDVEKIATEWQELHPDFRIALGNEIYLTDDRSMGQKYYHFILIAKDAIGHKALRELSSTAWYYSYYDRGLERVPTLKSELETVINKYKNHVIATSACMGGELSSNALMYSKCISVNDVDNAKIYYDKIISFIEFCINLFGEDFYIECAPSTYKDQIIVNQQLYKIAQAYNIKMVIGTDAHYLNKEDTSVHTAFLNSKGGERETADFYKFTYLMDSDEIFELLKKSFDKETIEIILNNTLLLQNKIEYYSLFHKQDIPSVNVKNYEKFEYTNDNYPNLKRLFNSNDIQDRYWVNQCAEALEKLELDSDERYWNELEEEARVKSIISKKLETNMFRYPNTLQHYIDLIWECGSIVGAGRGSSCAALNHYLMGITQLDPVQWNLPFFRYLNDERVELGDIDLDICPSKRPLILQKIREERQQMLNDDLPQWAKENLGCTLIATFGTESTKSAILTACRGYRSEDYPEGIDVDEAQYMSSLIPQERGFLWSVHDVVYGNPDKNRRPSVQFLNELKQYPGLLDTIIAIEGIISQRSSHASGVILFDGDPFDRCAFMKTPSGDIITQFDLHDSEYMGNTKYDFLVTDVSDKLVQCIQLLQEDGLIESNLSLREVYNKYLHPNKLPLTDKMWNALGNGTVLNCFQFDSIEGSKVAKKLKPRSIQEMSSANGLMRLMGEEGEERPIDKYDRQKKDINIWYREMSKEGLTIQEQETIKPYFEQDYGVPPDQESLMLMLMDPDICAFSLGEANTARKIIGKKIMSKIPQLKEKIYSQAKSKALGDYIWKHGASPQLGYSFSRIHALAYSFIGAQTLYIATNWNPVYWNTACLIVNSGSLEDNSEEEIVDIYEPEYQELTEGTTFKDLPDRSGKIKKTSSTDYGKMAKALGDTIKEGINITLVDINKSGFGFKPDATNNQILFGLKALLNVSDELVYTIINNRPYSSLKDFIERVKPNKQAMISLIKAGAFDSMMDRIDCMKAYIWDTCDKKKKLNLQNFSTLLKRELVPFDTQERQEAFKFYEFTRYLKAKCKKDKLIYELDARALDFLCAEGYDNLIYDNCLMDITKWDKVYQRYMDVFRKWLSDEQLDVLQKLNNIVFAEDWKKYAGKGNISAWEMETMCFYYHEHELAHINTSKYAIKDFNSLPENPIIERSFVKGGKTINIFKLDRIMGTCIAKNKAKSTVTLLTPTGVVNVKLQKGQFAYYDKQISERNSEGVKKVLEKSWFNRGNMIVVQGVRIGDEFMAKKYASSIGHQLYRIEEITSNKELVLRSERYQGEEDV